MYVMFLWMTVYTTFSHEEGVLSPFLLRQKKGFSFFSFGATPSRTVPKTQPLQVVFSQRGDFGEENCLGRGWGGQGKDKEKRMRKKMWVLWQKYRDRNGRCIAILVIKSIAVRGRFHSPEKCCALRVVFCLSLAKCSKTGPKFY